MSASVARRSRIGRLSGAAVLLLLLGCTAAVADPGRSGGGDRHGRMERGGAHVQRFHPRYPQRYPQPIYIPPPVYYEPPQAPGISLFLPFNLRR